MSNICLIMLDYNPEWCEAWRHTRNYVGWARKMNQHSKPIGRIIGVNPGHPYRGSLKLGDVSLRMSHLIGSATNAQQQESLRSAKVSMLFCSYHQ